MKTKIEGNDIEMLPSGHISIVGEFSSNYGRIDNGRLSMDWEYGMTKKVIHWLRNHELLVKENGGEA